MNTAQKLSPRWTPFLTGGEAKRPRRAGTSELDSASLIGAAAGRWVRGWLCDEQQSGLQQDTVSNQPHEHTRG